jgi:hypothetical protein
MAQWDNNMRKRFRAKAHDVVHKELFGSKFSILHVLVVLQDCTMPQRNGNVPC